MKKTLPIRLLALVLCVAMLVTVTPIFAAAATAIPEIIITNADITPVIGKPAGDFLSYTLPDNAPYTCTSYYWYNDTKGVQLKSDDIFVKEDLYSLFVSLVPKAGYAFANGASVSINGGAGSADEDNTWIMSDVAAIWMERTAAVAALPIKDFTISNVTTKPLVAGERVGNNVPTFTLADNAHFSCVKSYWFSIDNYAPVGENDTFTKGDAYFLALEIVPDDGYAFYSGSVLITVTNDVGRNLGIGPNTNVSGDHGVIYTGFFYVSDPPEISEINLLDADLVPAVGEKAGDHLSYTLPASAPYTCTQQYWVDDSTGKPLAEDDLFAAGSSYSLVWVIEADKDHTFNDAMRISINGDTNNVNLTDTLLGETQCTIYSNSIPTFVPPISEISLTEANVTPVVNEKASDHLAYTLPEDAQFTCTEHYWYNDTEGVKLKEDDTFAEGNSYSLKWVLVPNTGYRFDTDASISLNGGETSIDEKNTSVAADRCVISTPSTEAVVSKEIHTINLTCPETLIAGARVSDYMDVSVPDDAKYTCMDFWWFNQTRWEDVSENGIFVEGVPYISRWVLWAEEGYSFADDVKILVNGVEGKTSELTQISGGTANIWTTPIETETPILISKIELTDMDVTPVLGQKSGNCLHVTLPENCGYTIHEHVWHDVKTWYHVGLDEVFRDDREYFVYITFTTLPGYAFSEDVQATINGSADSVDPDNGGREGSHDFVIWTKRTKTPPPTAISEINLTDVDMTPVVGEKNGDWRHATLPENCGYTISEHHWQKVGAGDMSSDVVFYAGTSYRVTFILKAEPGYIFAEDAVVTVNGSAELVDTGNSRRLNTNEFRVWTAEVQTPPPTAISEINLTDVDVTPVADMRMGDLQHVTVPEDCGYTVSNYLWNEYGVGNCEDDDVFVAGASYRVLIRLQADPNYAFSDDVVVTINGSTADVDVVYSGTNNSYEVSVWTKPREAQYAFDLESGIHLMVGKTWVCTKNAADILGDGRASYDDATKTLTLKYFTMLGCSYVEEVETYCSIYASQYITINVEGSCLVHQGMETLDKPCCGIYVAGSGDECPPLLTGDGSLSVYAGDTFGGDSTAVYEAAENVEIASTGSLLFQSSLCGDGGESKPLSCLGSVFFSGLNAKHDLSLLSTKEVTLQAAFPCDVTATLFTTGEYERVEAPAESFEKKDGLTYFNLGKGYAEAYISFRENVIDTIELGGTCYPIIGGKVSDYSHFTLPEGVPYHFDEEGLYWKNDTDNVKMNADDTFEKGKSYSVGGCLVADTEYAFDTKPTILLNGDKFTTAKERTKVDELDAHLFNIWSKSREAVKGVIDTVEINGFQVPVAGKKAGEYVDLTIPESAQYAFVPNSLCWTNYTDTVGVGEYETFEKDKLYALGGTLIADEDYIFAEDVEAILNGGKFGVDEDYTYVSGNDERYFFFSGVSRKALDQSEQSDTTVDLRIGDQVFTGIKGGETLDVTSLDVLQDITVLVQDGVDVEGLSDEWSMSTKFLDSEGRGVLEVQVFEQGDDYVTFNLQSHYADCPGAWLEDFQIMLITVRLPQVLMLGDANDDGAVNMKDVLTLRKMLASIEIAYNAKNADVNGDGDVNMKDVLMLRKYLAGLIETLGA